MSVHVRPGVRLRSAVCSTEVIVVRARASDVDLRCGGRPLLPLAAERGHGSPVLPPFDEGTLVGKRYVDDAAGLEVLCTKAGAGSLSVAEAPLALKDAKPLPSSD